MISFDLHKNLNAPSGKMELKIRAEFGDGEISSLFGPSGAGKSSILKMLAGLMKPDKGYIKKREEVWFDSNARINIRSRFRNVAYVFQEPALFPNMNILQNLHYARSKDTSDSEIQDILELMELGELAKLKPNVLSGGQKRKCSIGRALAQKPQILFLDEPFSGLDNTIKIKLQHYILKIHAQFGISIILVSHDLRDVLLLSNKIFKINNGKLEGILEPKDFIVNKNGNSGNKIKARIIETPQKDKLNEVMVLIGEEVYTVKIENQNLKKGDFIFLDSMQLRQISS